MPSESPVATAEHRAEALKERVYVTFTSLAVVLAMQSHSTEHLGAGEAASTLSITVIGTLLAVFVADVVSHLAVHATVPTAAEIRRMAAVSFGAFATVVLPLVFIGFAGLDSWSVDTALRASTIALTVSLIAIGFLAVRRVKLAWWQRLVVLGAEFAVGAAVVGLELLAHG
jgi:ABC-type phosphate/phosphonate transport system permease subunit